MQTLTRYYKIGSFQFSITNPEDFIIPENFLKFEQKKHSISCDYHYIIDYVSSIPEMEGEILTRREDLLVTEKDGLESRLIGIKGFPKPYALYKEIDINHAQIFFDYEQAKGLHIDPVFSSLFALERRALAKEEIVLHTAYIEHDGQAILFSAPSETGKTTQANLWEKYRDARTINGDRSLLSKIDGTWHAGGWPVCGTSEICNDITMPIKAIVMLSQAPENSIEHLHPMKAFSQVYSQITINRWNTDAHNKAMNLIENLITEVPVYHLACNISEDAVECLESALNNKKII